MSRRKWLLCLLMAAVPPCWSNPMEASDLAASLPSESASDGSTRVWRVGPLRDIKRPSQLAGQLRSGDTVEIDAGVYRNDYAHWRQSNITLRGVGGMANLVSRGLIPNGKAIWIIDGDNVRVENISFSGAAVRHTNGAGIRHQGGRLTLRNTFFHNNEFSILSGKLPNADIDIQDSRFWHQKRPVRHSHGIYIGRARSLTLIGNHFTATDLGHQVKSRALHNVIAYNRIEDVPGGNSSRLIDLSNCGYSLVLGNQMHQASSSENFNAISFGPEGCDDRTGRQKQLFVVHNTFINEAPSGDFVHNFEGENSRVLVANNLIFGAGKHLVGSGEAKGNLRLPLAAAPDGRWFSFVPDQAIDTAVDLSALEQGRLLPSRMFRPPAGALLRPTSRRLDVGAAEAP